MFDRFSLKTSSLAGCLFLLTTLSACLWATPAPSAQLRMDEQGNTYALWEEQTNGTIVYAWKPDGQPWNTNITVSDQNFTSYEPVLRTNSVGDCVAVWLTINPLWSTVVVMGSYKPHDSTTWTTPIPLSNSYELVEDQHSISINDLGTFVACWSSLNLSDNQQAVGTRFGTVSDGWGAAAYIPQ